ncbi:hypothetical protein McpSp1_16010 [Methanocorpusculaceae archaeon Sp1]|nr:hypothetical protein [Methanocorpusculaceae archaeon Sp1]
MAERHAMRFSLFGIFLYLDALGVTTEHTEHTEFHGKNTEYRFAYGKHEKPKKVGISKR